MKVEEIKTISVIGAGLMGHGIAQEFALAGYEVRLNDVSGQKLEQALENIRANLRMFVETGLATREQADVAPGNIRLDTELGEAATDTDIVIEAVFENLKLKREIFRSLDRLCPERTILASNTSSLLPGSLASATNRPDRVLVAHFFNPPHLLPLVELVGCKDTSGETIATVYDLLAKIGKSPVVVKKAVPGFIGNRLQTALFREALSLVQQGIATPQDVDTVIRTSFGRRLAAAGVFEIWELVGWDLVLAVCENLIPDIDSSTEVPPLLKEKVEQGELGVKTGKGFYPWTPGSAAALRERIAKTLVQIAQQRKTE